MCHPDEPRGNWGPITPAYNCSKSRRGFLPTGFLRLRHCVLHCCWCLKCLWLARVCAFWRFHHLWFFLMYVFKHKMKTLWLTVWVLTRTFAWREKKKKQSSWNNRETHNHHQTCVWDSSCSCCCFKVCVAHISWLRSLLAVLWESSGRHKLSTCVCML